MIPLNSLDSKSIAGDIQSLFSENQMKQYFMGSKYYYFILVAKGQEFKTRVFAFAIEYSKPMVANYLSTE